MDEKTVIIPFAYRVIEMPAFELLGFTKVVTSGGELYDAVRGDGRWAMLRQMVGSDPAIYGVASFDKECPKDHYRYTLAVRCDPDAEGSLLNNKALFPFHVKHSRWVAFKLEHFVRDYGIFWQKDPYKMLAEIGYVFNTALSIHIDLYSQNYTSDDDAMEFLMPIKD